MGLHLSSEKLPLFGRKKRYPRTGFFILDSAAQFVWILRIFSPAAWILAFFQRERDGSYYTQPLATEIYTLAAVGFPYLILAASCFFQHNFPILTFLCIILGVESIQNQFFNLVLRPALQPTYRAYSASRTLLILMLQYVQAIGVYATVYLNYVSISFNIKQFNGAAALEFSALTMTTVSFGTIVPNVGSAAALVAASQALLGIFFVAVMISTALSRTRRVDEVGGPGE